MIHLYAFMRHTDDIGDSDAPLEIKRTDLDAWEESLQAALAGSATVDMTDDGPTRLLPALAETVRRFDIPQSSLRAVIDGVRMGPGTARISHVRRTGGILPSGRFGRRHCLHSYLGSKQLD